MMALNILNVFSVFSLTKKKLQTMMLTTYLELHILQTTKGCCCVRPLENIIMLSKI